jgi:hypothetical protein
MWTSMSGDVTQASPGAPGGNSIRGSEQHGLSLFGRVPDKG